MTNMTTLGKVIDRVENMATNHNDALIDVGDIEFQDLETVKLAGEPHRMRPIAQQSISTRLGIPYQYLQRCPPEIQEINLNHWIEKERNEQLFFRFYGAEVRAIFTPRYIPTDNLEVIDRILSLGYGRDDIVQCSLDDHFMMVNIPDGRQSFTVNGEKMTPGISLSNSEVGLASLSIAAFVLRLVCTNGSISKTEVSASYRHISTKIVKHLPEVFSKVSQELMLKRDQFKLSLESRVDHIESTIDRFNKQFLLNKTEKEAVEWALPQEYGETMFHVVNTYTKAAQFKELPAESGYRLQRVGGMILGMVG